METGHKVRGQETFFEKSYSKKNDLGNWSWPTNKEKKELDKTIQKRVFVQVSGCFFPEKDLLGKKKKVWR
jgi:hypothetical protein